MSRSYFPAIRQGRKTTTLRAWKRRQAVPGRTHRIRGLGQLLITSVEQVSLAELDDADARADGFSDKGELLAALNKHYDELPETLWRVRFLFAGE